MSEETTTHPILSMPRYRDHIIERGEHAGFQWIISHNDIGYRCGYVRIPDGHPWHEASEEKIDAEVHGGLTFGERGTDGSWWVGFDCAHSGDAPDPDLSGFIPRTRGTIRAYESIKTTEYVRKQCVSLCEQAEKAMIAKTSAHNN